ncbi:MAG: hypothetical protein ACD_16C00054G0003 [uncultured bacterium]|nr:MAG: hypothetical protein ACD_16C00054G0003 [uncultured bacterium]OFW67895.1 MAG: hypothetical protein A2X70_06150 [Alphaproteobacteria bacterium GWC2_42_16]OFW73730.1 MAG: hypothetical protein A2Z80_01220 [Alphaproteobacteria bacterium GWA2_41_27]OFW82140.1 MAG: hypothetical protein A3E50_04860 [Alphaproteobacteria bacterium RIFCSPHIGHO2_12_FULL_42_100]OFW85203.1 MAG: hypothetical protein A2W06_02420 [Alphaproteobacteria bacterium RBG_16_42_14]OFW90843.1 MAG: hypothetical protein A2W46_069
MTKIFLQMYILIITFTTMTVYSNEVHCLPYCCCTPEKADLGPLMIKKGGCVDGDGKMCTTLNNRVAVKGIITCAGVKRSGDCTTDAKKYNQADPCML